MCQCINDNWSVRPTPEFVKTYVQFFAVELFVFLPLLNKNTSSVVIMSNLKNK
jgi:hypothetical protein